MRRQEPYSLFLRLIKRPDPSNRSSIPGINAVTRWRSFTYDELMARDKANLDIFWLRDESLEDSANLPAPEVLAQEIADDLEAALEQIRGVLNGLEEK